MVELHPSVIRVQKQPRIEQRSDGWYQTRGKLLTASDAAAALGVPPYHSYTGNPKNELVQRKAEQAVGINTFTGNAATQHGQTYEQEALDIYMQRTGETALDFGLLIHPTHSWLGGSPDGITASGILLEVELLSTSKTLRRRRKPNDRVPRSDKMSIDEEDRRWRLSSSLFASGKIIMSLNQALSMSRSCAVGDWDLTEAGGCP